MRLEQRNQVSLGTTADFFLGGLVVRVFRMKISGHKLSCLECPLLADIVAPAALFSMMLTLHEIWHLPREIGNDGRSHGRDRLERCSKRQVSESELAHDVCHASLNELALERFSHRGR